MLGLHAQKTRLGTFRNGREKIVCACSDFTADGRLLYDFCSVKNTVLESESGGTGTELSDVLDAIDGQSFVDPAMLGGRKINYADFLASSDDPDLAAARARIVTRIDPAAFARLVSETPYLTDLQRDFYATYFAARAEKLFGVS